MKAGSPVFRRGELEDSSFDDLTVGLTDVTITRSRAIKLAGAALIGGALTVLWADEADARKKKRRHRRRRATRVKTNRRRVRFRNTPVGTLPSESPVENVTITNPGTQPITIEPVFSSPDFTLAPGFTFPSEIAAGKNVTVPIVFTPLQEGVQTGELTFVDTDGSPVVIVDAHGNTVDAIDLEGTGLPEL
jgi:hypothetical protein